VNESLLLAKHIYNTGFNDLPAEAVTAAKRSLLDGTGVTLAAGTLGEGCRQFVELAQAGGGKPESSILGFNSRTTAVMAAFANGSMAHALDFEDTHDAARVHPNAAAIPAALAVAESNGNISGKELITSLALASDIVCRLGLALKEDPIKYGWYIPPALGAFGATTATCKLMQLKPEQILDAFSLTLCQATCSAELTHNPYSIIRAIRDAFAAKAGVLSAHLAARDITGFKQPLEGQAGLYRLYARENYDLASLTAGLGKIFEGANVSYKPWPSCRGTHYFIEAALQVVKANTITNDEIKEIAVSFGPGDLNLALCEPLETKRKPIKAIDAKFSIPFTVALAIAEKKVTLEHFFPQALKNPEVLALAEKVIYRMERSLRKDEGLVQLKTARGLYQSKTPEYVQGHPFNPLSADALVNKFRDCARHAPIEIQPEKLDRFIEQVLNLEEVPRIDEVIQGLNG
jgi:2-methylcitrate dehydratase PrpD